MGGQLEDMTQTFRNKAQQFAEQLVGEVFASKEGSTESIEPAGDPPVAPPSVEGASPSDPQAYRDESRVSEFGEWALYLLLNIYWKCFIELVIY